MRAVVSCLLLAACVTAGVQPPPPERVTGCWISREALMATMRWAPDPSRAGVMAGSRVQYGATSPTRTRYSMEQSAAGWSFCEIDSSGAASRCWLVAEGEGGSLEGGRVFIDAHGDRLNITVIGDGPEQVIFRGRRDGCE
jgi:hypothetical protein